MNILVIKTGALGDVVRTSFIAQALKDKYKKQNPKVFWITSQKAISLFINNPYISKVVSSEEKNSLRGIYFDLILNLEEDEENARFVSSLNRGKIIGVFFNGGKIDYTSDTSFWFDTSLISKKGKKKADVLKKKNKKTYRQILSEIIGIENHEKYEPFLRLNKLQRDIANNFLRRYTLSKTDFIVGLNLGSGERWPKDLPIKTAVELIDGISENFNAKILLFGGPQEERRNMEILAKSKSPVIATGSGNNLLEFPALVSLCNFFITTDTLGLHVALALKKKTISLIGPTSHTEIDMYGLGEKIISKSNCLCCYDEKCRSMEKISATEILRKMKEMLDFKISLIITGFKEPKIGKAIECALNQKTNYDYDIIVSAPDEQTLEMAREYSKKNKKIKLFKDPGKGKMFALNMIISKSNKNDLLILTDGDVYISENSVEEITNLFLDQEIGCVTGRPTPIESKNTRYGYWANFLFDAAHKLRKKAFERHDFLECSGYLWAFRGDNSLRIPLDTAEDAIIPYYLWEKGYKIGYAENAKVFVKNVENWKDWIKQKVRTSKAHETIDKYADTKTTPRVKTFKTESKGIYDLFKYPKNIKEFYWSNLLALSRVYMWGLVFYNSKIKKFESVDNWERIESAR
ncbi:MAG: glycosyltransferase family 9 protein [Nanoarchaeota archaeon]|nr:glycosyltransferase family 9 protein [Nanoarchaeota archaeon]